MMVKNSQEFQVKIETLYWGSDLTVNKLTRLTRSITTHHDML